VSNPRRIGVFGGTFDPVHNAHCDIARTARDAAHLDRVLFVVAGRPPHKTEGASASAEDRFAMVRAAIKDLPGMAASRIEIDRGGPSYTVDTLRAIERRYPGARLFLIIGYDSLLDLPKWRDPAGILARAGLLVVPRPGLATEVPAQFEGRYDLLPFRETPVSSTDIRERILAGRPFEDLVPAAAARLIRERGIYHAHHADGAR
jgi:nicotinate-nucleotide adenylyltransferase